MTPMGYQNGITVKSFLPSVRVEQARGNEKHTKIVV